MLNLSHMEEDHALVFRNQEMTRGLKGFFISLIF
jgi:hypothetical protein